MIHKGTCKYNNKYIYNIQVKKLNNYLKNILMFKNIPYIGIFKNANYLKHCSTKWEKIFDSIKDCSNFVLHCMIEYMFHGWLYLRKSTKNLKRTEDLHLTEFIYLVSIDS